MEQIEKLLRTLPLFRSFTSATLKKLIRKSQIKTFPSRETIISFGQPGRFLGIMLEGEAEAVVTSRAGTRKRLGVLKQGDFLGEMSLLTGEPTSADVIALTHCLLFLIPHEIFSTFLAGNPETVKVMAKTITERYKSRQQDEEAQERVEDAWQSAPDPYGLRLSAATPMKILVLNCGSSSLKYQYFDTAQETNNLKGIVERIGLENARIISSSKRGKVSREIGSIDHSGAFRAVVSLLTDPDDGVLGDLQELTAVGHRVVHGGDKYSNPVIIDDEVIPSTS